MNEHIEDRLHAIVAAAVALRYLLEFDSDEWRALPTLVQNAVNSAAIACDKLSPAIIESVEP